MVRATRWAKEALVRSASVNLLVSGAEGCGCSLAMTTAAPRVGDAAMLCDLSEGSSGIEPRQKEQ